MKGDLLAKKDFQGLETEMRELLGGRKENNILSNDWSLADGPFLQKNERKKLSQWPHLCYRGGGG